MRYEWVRLNDGRIYCVDIPENPSEGELDLKDRIILELYYRYNRYNFIYNDRFYQWLQDVGIITPKWKCSLN